MLTQLEEAAAFVQLCSCRWLPGPAAQASSLLDAAVPMQSAAPQEVASRTLTHQQSERDDLERAASSLRAPRGSGSRRLHTEQYEYPAS